MLSFFSHLNRNGKSMIGMKQTTTRILDSDPPVVPAAYPKPELELLPFPSLQRHNQ